MPLEAPVTRTFFPSAGELFAPRPPLSYAKPLERDPTRGKRNTITGIVGLMDSIRHENEKVTDDQDEKAQQNGINDNDRKSQLQAEKATKRKDTFNSALSQYNPQSDSEAIGDPFKTLFIARLTAETNESDLRKEFEVYGPVERVRIVRHKDTGNSRRYAFIIFEKERDMKAAYKDAEGLKINGNRILVDVERGRTVKNWKPRRLGGGLGGKPKAVIPDLPPPRGPRGPPGGSRGGFGPPGPRRSDGGGRFGPPGGGPGRFSRDRDRDRDGPRFGGDRPMRHWGGPPRDRDRGDRDGPRRSFGGFKREFDGGDDRDAKRYRY
ncbi:hypothetical protein E3P86_01787 [Wallemia ichthyophaga]|uniref:U1 small nuclear ribonucleoprotein 70 kDa n=1 Tax=Wallemia ichthyophaga TaxID=245174 RepID=A0A4T0J7Q4_WALIC|nr:hypothetical protein E3P86_01787 [Wallemia ichthyophaga]